VNVVELYIDFLCSELGEEYVELMTIPPGKIVLDARREDLFKHKHVVLWHRFACRYLPIAKGLVALVLPCTRIKPYRISATHRLAEARIRKLGIEPFVDVYILSEPMALVPRELDIYYPFANYDYDPKLLSDEHREMLIGIVAKILSKFDVYKHVIAVLPRHHRKIFESSVLRAGINNVTLFNYDRLAFKSVAEAVDFAAKIIAKLA